MEVKKKGSITAFMLPFFILLYFMPLINLSNIENAKSGYTDQDFPGLNPLANFFYNQKGRFRYQLPVFFSRSGFRGCVYRRCYISPQTTLWEMIVMRFVCKFLREIGQIDQCIPNAKLCVDCCGLSKS